MKLIPRTNIFYNFREALSTLSFSKDNIPKFENQFAKKFECKEGVMFSYGRTGLYGLFKVWGLDQDEIICPAYTCLVVPHAIVLSCNTPVFIDCAKDSFNMDIDKIEVSITEKTRAIIVTHMFGYSMDVNRIDKIVKIAEQKYGQKIYVVQDCALSFGCRWEGNLVTRYGDAAIFGLNISKMINSIFGGMVITNSSQTADSLRDFREQHIRAASFSKFFNRFLYFWTVYLLLNEYTYCFVNWCEQKGLLNRFVKNYSEEIISFPKDWDQMPLEIEARIGLIQLSKYEDIYKTKKKNSKKIQTLLEKKGIQYLTQNEGFSYSYFIGISEKHTQLIKEYCKKGVQLGKVIDYVIPLLDAYKKYSNQKYPNAEYFSTRTFNFPNWKFNNHLNQEVE